MEGLLHKIPSDTRQADAILESVFPKLSFPCMVNNKKLVATLREEVENPLSAFFRFSFSDGYQTVFQRTRDEWVDAKTGGGSAYLSGIFQDLQSMAGFQNIRGTASFPALLNGKSCNVFIVDTQREDAGPVKAVYYNADYRFDLKKIQGKWHARTIRVIEPEIINEEIALRAVQYLNASAAD